MNSSDAYLLTNEIRDILRWFVGSPRTRSTLQRAIDMLDAQTQRIEELESRCVDDGK